MRKHMRVAILATAAAISATLLTTPASANAETQIGWTGGTPPLSGTIYLHNSSVTNDGGLHARSKLWTSFGNTVAPGTMGVRTRLFKSGVICEVVDYVYNMSWTSSVESQSTTDCGSGSYNSHGFVKVFDGSQFKEYVTFPSNPINYTAPSARTSQIKDETVSTARSFTVDGQSFGPASQDRNSIDRDPDFVAVYADNGRFGYARAEFVKTAKRGTSTPVRGADGKSEVGRFTIK